MHGAALTLEHEGTPFGAARRARPVAVGRRPALASLGLERGRRTSVEHGVPVHDEYLRTSNAAIFVAGDAAGPPALLHTGALQGAPPVTTPRDPTTSEEPPSIRAGDRVLGPAVATVRLDPRLRPGRAIVRARRTPAVERSGKGARHRSDRRRGAARGGRLDPEGARLSDRSARAPTS